MDDRLYVIKYYDLRTKLWEPVYEERFTLSEIVECLEDNLQSDEDDNRLCRYMIEVVRD